MFIDSNAFSIETPHTSLDIFERPQLLINFDGSFEQKLGSLYLQMDQRWSFKSRETGPTLSIYKTFICQMKIVKADNTISNSLTGVAIQQDTLHSLFSDAL